MSTKLGENVGCFNDEGVFYFNRKVEIRKTNLHYKLLADNRAKFARKTKLESKEKLIEPDIDKNVLKSKVNHRKYLKKLGKINLFKIYFV